MAGPAERDLVARLRAAGFVAAEDEARQLLAAAARRGRPLDHLVDRRLAGEPLAWIVGQVRFDGLDLQVDPGVYVPRPRTVAVVHRGVDRLPATGVAVDVCTGSGAIAAVLVRDRPRARVIATEVDPAAVACARVNGVDARRGHLLEPVPAELHGRVDLVIGSVPYVPTRALSTLQRDTFAFESATAYDGGDRGLDVLVAVLAGAGRFLRPGGAVVLELGGDQGDQLRDDLARYAYECAVVLRDDDDDVCGIEATWTGVSTAAAAD